jgi:hypothetical protein
MLRRAFKNYCYDKGLFAKTNAAQNDVQRLIKKLRPVKTNYPLIRIGSPSDGGYLIPNMIDGIQAAYSPGVSNNSSFELELAKKGIQCYLIDYSVDKAAEEHELIHFDKKFLGFTDDDIHWTLDSWVKKYTPTSNQLLMQIDIEGAEYESIISASQETLSRFKVIIAEFHGLDSIFSLYGFKLINLCFEKLLKDFYVVHLHPNNCEGEVRKWGFSVPRVMEITFIRKDACQNLGFASQYPHHLDQACVTSNPDLVLDQFWYND